MKKCSRCKCEVEDEDFEMYGGYCEGCGIHLCNAEIAKYSEELSKIVFDDKLLDDLIMSVALYDMLNEKS